MRWSFIFIFFAGAAILLVSKTELRAQTTSTLETSVVATEQAILVAQSDYRWYANTDALTPVSPLGGENASTETPAQGETTRLRMNLESTSLNLSSGATFLLQYSNTTSTGFTTMGTSTAWIFGDNASVADGQVIVNTVLTDSDDGETYNESNPTAALPTTILTGRKGEFDWVIKNNSASTGGSWFFRMIFSSSTPFDTYENFPAFTAVVSSPPTPSGSGGVTPVPPAVGGLLPPFPPVRPRPRTPAPSLIVDIVDLNGDRRIDMADFSILLYYFGQQGGSVARYDLNGDGTVNMADVSILLYYWVV